MRGLVDAGVGVLLLVVSTGCGRIWFETAALDGSAPNDSGQDAALADTGVDATAIDDAATEAGADGGTDATIDASTDAATDAATDAMGADAATDAGTIVVTYPLVVAPALSGIAYHTCTVRMGALHCWGDNGSGELGVGDTVDRLAPVAVTLPSGGNVAQVSAGEGHTCAIEDGTFDLYCWGRNDFGQLGLGDRGMRTQPTLVTGVSRVVQVSAGYGFTCAIDADNALWCWGDNAEGGLGLDDGANRIDEQLVPIRSGSEVDWIQISAGQGRTCGLRNPGSLWCVGRNGFYGLGLGSNQPIEYRAWTRSGTQTDWTRVSVSQDAACGLRSGSSAYCWGRFATLPLATTLPSPLQLGPPEWAHGAAGVFNLCGVVQTGAIVCWGRNDEGQLGRGDLLPSDGSTPSGTDTDWSTVAMGRFHTCAQKLDGRVYCAGANISGELGLGDMNRRSVFTQVTFP